MIELKLNLPDWFLYVVTAYFAIRVLFNVFGVYFRRRAAKRNKKVRVPNRRFR